MIEQKTVNLKKVLFLSGTNCLFCPKFAARIIQFETSFRSLFFIFGFGPAHLAAQHCG